ncbi:aldehyde dehydrogenase family protein [Ornithinimicrobium sp. INDO-MA30-4]|uniref:aldehyde dehydrogenase family protein n=1 Tax=Ornithinimicrobium sp. INDO-MA30-4 TaxID=2908651 RepID=UPI001F2AD2A8|nr:aldehyde dehydrogenase family protein [Ornithinimicrobium sp. INDO-MA30-4]UJH70156.1 aldehyde dehydrogenase family protein [Ornithinimicrobium sp. INDO-MA30-4]
MTIQTAVNLDATVATVNAAQRDWAAMPVAQRRKMLLEVGALCADNAQRWVNIAAEIKGLPASSPLVGEEWSSGPYAVQTYVEALAETLSRLDGDEVLRGYAVKPAPGGRQSVSVLPHSVFDRLLFSGFAAHVWTRPGVTEVQLRERAGLTQLDPSHTGGVSVVLGAGNIFAIAPLDVLYELFAHNRTVILKLNPITDDLLSVYQDIFEPFLAAGLVAIVTGGADVGSALTSHPDITSVHMTGSEQTFNAIVWGSGAEGEANRRLGERQVDKPVTAELGGVSPVIVVPGQWSKADLKFQANHVATMRLHNGGFNCIAGQVVIVSSDWAQKDEFLAEVRTALADAPKRPGWYPGSDGRVSDACTTYDQAEAVAGQRTLVTGLSLDDVEPALSTEYFAPVLGVAEIEGEGEVFLAHAIDASNEHLHGTLGANIIMDPKTKKAIGPSLEALVARLRYGTIGVNAWTALGFLSPRATWGAFPGHTPEDVQSGIGVVHNALLLDDVERTVVSGPFRPLPRSLMGGELSISPKPPWFVNNTTAATTARRLTAFAAKPQWRKFPAIFASALRG